MKNLFSINKAADLLERDRQTLVRALRHIEPDGIERGQQRYTMRTITDALAAHEGRAKTGTDDDGISRDLRAKFDELDRQYRAVQNGATLVERRKLVREFFSGLAGVEAAMYSAAKRDREDHRAASLRIAEHTRLQVLTLRDALGWTCDEVWVEFMKADHRGRDLDGAA